MNVLNTNYFLKYGAITFWTKPCESILKAVSAIDNPKENTKGEKVTQNCSKTKPAALKTNPGLAWTRFIQVRYKSDLVKCPPETQSENPKPNCTPPTKSHLDVISSFPSFDNYRKEPFISTKTTSWGQGDDKIGATYLVGVLCMFAGHYGAKSVITHYVSAMAAAADVVALASIEVDLTVIPEGTTTLVKWRGKPLFIKHRTEKDKAEDSTPMSSLKDPVPADVMAPNPDWLIVIGICTHLGCVPIPNSGDFAGGFYCPCHGSHYDSLGRIRKGPAPINLEVPPFKFVSASTVKIG